MLSVRAPATSANLGPGFDALSLALDVANVVHAWRSDRVHVDVVGEGAGLLPSDASNEVYRALVLPFAARGQQPPVLRLRCENFVPPSRGLGSSSAARASGLLLGNALLDDPLTLDELLGIGAELEGHPDNIAACLLGGVQVCVETSSGIEHCRVPVAMPLHATVFVPDFPMDTRSARGLLPTSVPLATAVHNIGRAALLVAALSSGRPELLRTATEDAIHQPPRAGIFPALPKLLAAALDGGAYGAFLSGAGSSVLALVGDERAGSVGNALAACAAAASVPGHVLQAGIAAQGAIVARRQRSGTLNDLWIRVSTLRGVSLTTVRGLRFSVDTIEGAHILVTPASTGMQRLIARNDIERALPFKLKDCKLRPSEIQAKIPGHRNTSYVAAIINAVVDETKGG